MDFKCVSNWHLEQCSVQDILTLGCLQSADRTSELHWWTELVDPTILVLKCIDDQYLLVLLCSGLANLPPLLSNYQQHNDPSWFLCLSLSVLCRFPQYFMLTLLNVTLLTWFPIIWLTKVDKQQHGYMHNTKPLETVLMVLSYLQELIESEFAAFYWSKGVIPVSLYCHR